jgi:hypothetical protein
MISFNFHSVYFAYSFYFEIPILRTVIEYDLKRYLKLIPATNVSEEGTKLSGSASEFSASGVPVKVVE